MTTPMKVKVNDLPASDAVRRRERFQGTAAVTGRRVPPTAIAYRSPA